jgi:hypothetical protein
MCDGMQVKEDKKRDNCIERCLPNAWDYDYHKKGCICDLTKIVK